MNKEIKDKVPKYIDEPAFKINSDIEEVFKNNYSKSVKKMVLDVSKEIVILASQEKHIDTYNNEQLV